MTCAVCADVLRIIFIVVRFGEVVRGFFFMLGTSIG